MTARNQIYFNMLTICVTSLAKLNINFRYFSSAEESSNQMIYINENNNFIIVVNSQNYYCDFKIYMVYK